MKYSIEEIINMRPSVSTYMDFILDNFSQDGMLIGLPIKSVNDKMIGTKNNLSFNQIMDIHKTNTTKVDGKIYVHPVSKDEATHFELRLAYTENIVCVDVDGIHENGDCCLTELWNVPNMKELFFDCTYTLSRKKQLPHFFFKLVGADISKLKSTTGNCFKDFKGDFLTNCTWEKIDNTIYNYDDTGLLYIHYDDIKPLLSKDIFKPPEKKNTPSNQLVVHKKSQLLSMIDIQYIDNYESWRQIISSAKNSGISKEEAIQFSQRSDKYSMESFENIWKYDYNAYTEGTLKYYAKISDLTAYMLYLENQPFEIPNGTMSIKRLNEIKSDIERYKVSKETKQEIVKLNTKEQRIRNDEEKENVEKNAWELYYDEMHLKKPYFEKYHVKLISPASFIRMSNREINLLNPKDFTLIYENVQILKPTTFGPKPVKYTDEWRNEEDIPTYDRIEFLPPPLKCPKKTFNAFTGLEVERCDCDEEIDISLFTYQLNLLCGEDEACTEYCLNWLAHRVQKPGSLPLLALVFLSEQGVGKNLFWDNFGNMILCEKYYLTSQDFNVLLGKFNSNVNKLLVVYDEVKGKNGFEFSEDIKVRITAPTIPWEQKYMPTINVNNCAGSVFLSNPSGSLTPLKIPTDDRRFQVHQCSSKHKGDSEYFNKLYKFLTDKRCMWKVYKMLMERDISNFDPARDTIKTKIYKDLQSVNIPPMARFFEEMVNNYEYSNTIEGETILNKIPAKELFQSFRQWLQQNGYTLEYNITKFGRELSSYNGIDKKKSSLITYIIDYDQLKSYLISKGYFEL